MINPLFERTKVFICHCHTSAQDTYHFEHLKRHLRQFERNGKINAWDNTSIQAGDHILEVIKQSINQTCVAVILLSSSLIADDFIDQRELTPLCHDAEHKKITLLPILLSACDWESMYPYLNELQFINAVVDSGYIPVEALSEGEREIVWKKTVEDILRILNAKQTKTKPTMLPPHYQNMLNQLADRALMSQQRIALAHSLIDSAETLTSDEQSLIQDNLHSIRLEEPDIQVYDAIILVLAFLNDNTASSRFQFLFVRNAIPRAFRKRAAKLIAHKIKGTDLIALLTGQEGTNHGLEAGLEIVYELRYTQRTDLKMLLRVTLNQHPFTTTVRTAILDALEITSD